MSRLDTYCLKELKNTSDGSTLVLSSSNILISASLVEVESTMSLGNQDLNVRNIVVQGSHNLNIDASTNKILMTASTISLLGAVSLTQTLSVQGTISAHTFISNSPLSFQASTTLNLQGSTRVNITSGSLVVVSGSIGLQNSHGLFTTGVTVLNYTAGNTTKTITSADYLVVVQVQDPLTSVTLNLPSSPLNGETHIVKGFHYGSGSANIDLVTTAVNGFENGKDVSPYVFTVTSSDASLRSVVLTYVASLQSWIAVFGYKN